MNLKLFKGLLGVALILALGTFSFSCKDDDDKADCTKLGTQWADAYEEYFNAVLAEDCDDIETHFTEVKNLLNQGKNCDALKEEIEDAGYDNVEDYIEELEEEHESYKDDLGC